MQELDEYINKVKNLPPAPRILPELLTLLRKENVDTSRVVQLISYDPAITASLLRLCNSVVFSGATPATDLDEAVNRLGYRQIYTLVAAISGSRALSPAQKGYGINAGELWKHSVTAAVAGQLIARSKDDPDEGLVFTAALLHDVGKIILADALEHNYARLVEESRAQQSAMIETEKRLLGVNHAEIGGRLLARWKFPDNLVAAVRHHHQPADAGPHNKLAAYVYLGNMVAYFMGHGYGHQAFAMRGRSEALEVLGLEDGAMAGFMIQTFEQLQLVETLFNVSP